MTKAGRRELEGLRVADPLQLELPWGGRSPRTLTKAYDRFTLRRKTSTVEEVDDLDEERIDEQYRRFQQDGG